MLTVGHRATYYASRASCGAASKSHNRSARNRLAPFQRQAKTALEEDTGFKHTAYLRRVLSHVPEHVARRILHRLHERYLPTREKVLVLVSWRQRYGPGLTARTVQEVRRAIGRVSGTTN